jgi:hypothetical protein
MHALVKSLLIVILIALIVSVEMLRWFKTKGWFWGSKDTCQ